MWLGRQQAPLACAGCCGGRSDAGLLCPQPDLLIAPTAAPAACRHAFYMQLSYLQCMHHVLRLLDLLPVWALGVGGHAPVLPVGELLWVIVMLGCCDFTCWAVVVPLAFGGGSRVAGCAPLIALALLCSGALLCSWGRHSGVPPGVIWAWCVRSCDAWISGNASV